MATVTGLTAARMAEIEDAQIVDASVVVDNLILETWYSNSMVAYPKELGQPEIQNHFPWNGQPVSW